MGLFYLGRTTTAQWHALVIEAAKKTGHSVDESLENYLVITLDHFTTNNEWINSAIALEFLNGLETTTRDGSQLLRHVGDQCLIVSGLFPEQVTHKNVSLEYLVTIGQQAYYTLAFTRQGLEIDTELFEKLGFNFVGLMDILSCMRTSN